MFARERILSQREMVYLFDCTGCMITDFFCETGAQWRSWP
jgi:hypothetical protein